MSYAPQKECKKEGIRKPKSYILPCGLYQMKYVLIDVNMKSY